MSSLATRIEKKLRYGGRGLWCPVCDGQARRWIELRGRPNARCLHCGALERHRALWLWLDPQLRDDMDVFHVAPEPALAERIRPRVRSYVSADLFSSYAEERIDVQDIPKPDDSFDLVICNHVLEHVEDDRRAMRELRRILRPGGMALLHHPVTGRSETFEDPTVTEPEDRLRVFGQEDHVRIYGADFPDRLTESGFEVDQFILEDQVPAEYFERCALRRSMMFVGR